MEQYLRSYVNYLQDNWGEWLALAEFATNNHVSETTGITPFYASTGRHPRFGVEPTISLPPPPSDHMKALDSAAADHFAEQMEQLTQHLQEQITFAQARYARNADASRNPSPAYKVGDEVWLSTKNIRTTRPAKKLDAKNVGPFAISEVINPRAYRLSLPSTMKIHNVFHTSLLHPVANDPYPQQAEQNVAPPPIVVEREGVEEKEWEVESIEDSKITGRKHKQLKYKVRWIGYPDATWEPASGLTGSQDLVDAFHARRPDRPGPPQVSNTPDTERRSGTVAERRSDTA